MTVTVNPLSDACGAEILGVDMKAELSKDDASTIYQAGLIISSLSSAISTS